LGEGTFDKGKDLAFPQIASEIITTCSKIFPVMSETPDKNDKTPAVENDPRFLSGPWVGFWIQHRLGKQRMSLSLAFVAGRVTGNGRDIVGRFAFDGTYDLKTGRVVMTKQYERAHRVDYDGTNQGDGMWLWGVWNIRTVRGGFHLWPEGEDDPTQGRLKAEKELQKPRRLKRGELVGGLVP
jgi:hypothetical protein